MTTPLDQIIDPVDTQETETVAEETTETTGEQETVEAATETVVEDSPPESDEVKGLKAALGAIRQEKRELKQQIESQKEQEPIPSVFDNEEDALAKREQRILQQVSGVLLAQQTAAAKRAYGADKVEQAIDWFNNVGPTAPALVQTFQEAGNDVFTIVDLYDKNQKAESLLNVDATEAKLRAEIEAKVRKELEDKPEADAALKGQVPGSLVGTDSQGNLKSSDWTGPTPLENIIPE